ncbi:LemA family protein [Ramlibacter sp. 2FC]|uniref:LemA family protein n=1 Tax=Ramlibacter sp. 2FC TaxID=2502188 RepID=UPI00201D4537|nr:LemA family protein [Ramlibacter sp. 2FC]
MPSSMSSLLSWALLAVAFFWAVGAYNRLVRLRAQVGQAFAALDAQLVRQLVWVQGSLPPALRGAAPAQPARADDAVGAAWASLQAASEQFAHSLAAARARPLDAAALAALSAARGVLETSWQRVWTLGEDPDGLALPEPMLGQHEQLLALALPLCEAFNGAVRGYNEAVVQFPAVLLARLFGFRQAGTLVPMALVAGEGA